MSIEPKKPVVFSAKSAGKIAEATHRVLNEPVSYDGRSAKSPVWTYGVVRAKVTTEIPGASFEDPSDTGEAQIYHMDAIFDWVPVDDPVKVRNQFGGSAISVGVSVMLAWIGGQWWVVAADCPPEE